MSRDRGVGIGDQGSRGAEHDDGVRARAARVRLILLDVDGVLTDGKVQIHGDGSESKSFDIKDGIALVWARRVGLTVGILSARASASTTHRAAQLGITLVHQGVSSKIDTYDQLVGDLCVDDQQVVYMGDDVVDLAVLERVGLSAAPADAVDEVRSRVHWVSRRRGGDGAVRELVELILRAQDRWDEVIASYIAASSSMADQ
jgi:3-deoxy-D-manno-octulosonate 8-phosphate phosphatase (KDO 8-P phosphatase)